MRYASPFFAFLLSAAPAFCQFPEVTLAGYWNFHGPQLRDIGWGLINSVAVDAAGNVYAAAVNRDEDRHVVLRLSPAGAVVVVAGGKSGFSGDGGPAVNASLNWPSGVALDRLGNLFIVDIQNHRIRKEGPDGIISTVAGNGIISFSGDGGPAVSASLYYPTAAALDQAGNLYIADTGSARIRKVTLDGIITTVAGGGPCCAFRDGVAATSVYLQPPTGVAVDGAGNLFIAAGDFLRKVNPAGITSTVAGGGSSLGDGGPASKARLLGPGMVALDGAGNIYLTEGSRLRRIDASGIISTVAGNERWAFWGDEGPATAASLAYPRGVAVDSIGNIYIADTYNQRIRKVDTRGIIHTLAGNGWYMFRGDGGPATAAVLNRPAGVAVDGSGGVYFADQFNSRIRKVRVDGTIITVAGGADTILLGDRRPATQASLAFPTGVAVAADGALYIADRLNNRIRKVNPAGIIETVAGGGAQFPGDGGLATDALLRGPFGVAVDEGGTVYFSDRENHRVCKVTPEGILITLAGDGSAGGGDRLSAPQGLAVGRDGALYVADTGNHRIVGISPRGTIMTVAGTGSNSFCGDGGPATAACLNSPQDVALDAQGNLYIADLGNHRIRMVRPDGTITTFRDRDCQICPPGPYPGAPVSLAVDAEANVYYSDRSSETVAKVFHVPPPSLPANSVVNGASFQAGSPVAPGSIVSIFGNGFAPGRGVAYGDPLPTTLLGTSATFNGISAPLFFATVNQINAQVPFELTSAVSAQVQVTRGEFSSGVQPVLIAPVSPAIFTINMRGTGQGAILDSRFRVVSGFAPAAAGEVVQVFCTGLGLAEPPVASGRTAPAVPLARAVTPVEARVGGLPARVLFAGLAPHYVGVYQVNVEIPAGVAPGPAVPLLILQNGVPSNTVTLALR